MKSIYNLIIDNVYLYICVIIVLLMLTTILSIVLSNKKKRKQIKDDFKEAEKLEEAIEEVEETPKNNELEELIQKMQEDINVKPEDVVKKFEEEQEEKAIISYQELVDNVATGKIDVVDDEESDVNFVETLTNSKDVVEVPNIEEEDITKEMVKDVINTISESSVKEEPKQFKQSEFISPIYGRMESNVEYPKVKKQDTLDVMDTKDYNKLTSEIKKQEDFLNELIEFRNNL